MQLKVCLFLLGFVGGCVAFGTMPPPPETEAGDDSLYVCFTALDCALKDTEYYEKLRECTKPLDDQDFEIGLQFLEKDAQISEFVDHLDALDNKYCVLPPEPRKERFKKILNGVMEIYSDCVTELMEEVKMDDKCDIKDLDAQFE